ncbi:tetratricopeptide repeat protein [Rubinisphaera italica]|uniref:tetratricopeptide repeat protein n=1 Tax=Rubinisphaera italica TaxID=2527969 RepID=UPI0013EF55BD|nr:tetratricopeptide repeat protein [Rubinisphaera italica]
MSRQVQLLLEKRKFDQARETCQSFLVQSSKSDVEKVLPRLEAISNLILIATQTKQEVSLDWAMGTLKTEVDSLLQNHSKAPIREEYCRQLILLSENLGRSRLWPAVKSISRLLTRNLIEDTPSSQGLRIRALNNLGSALLAENRIEDAAHVWQCAINDYDTKTPNNNPAPISTLHNNLAELRRLQCRMLEARYHHRRALELRRMCFANTDQLIRQSQYNLSQILIECLEYTHAAEQIDDYLNSFAEDSQGSVEYLRGKVFQCRLLMDQGQYHSADAQINHLARDLNGNTTIPGRLKVELHLHRLEIAILLGKDNVINSEMKRLPEMLAEFELTGSIYDGRFRYLLGRTPTTIDLSPLDNNREVHLQAAMQILHKRLVRNHPLVANTIFTLADHFQQTHRGQRGVQSANGALELYIQTFSEGSLPVAYAMTRQAKVVCAQKHFKMTRKLIRNALNITREYVSVPSLTLLECYDLLSQAYEGLGKDRLASYFAAAAARQIQQTLEFPAAMEDFYVDRALQLAEDIGHDPRTIALLNRRIVLIGEQHHADHPFVAEAMEKLGRIYARQNNYSEAARCLSKALPIRCSELGEESPVAVELMQLTADVCREAGQVDHAEELEGQIQQLSDKASHVLSDLL